MHSYIVVTSLTIAFFATTYSVIRTTSSDSSSVPWMAAIAGAGVVFLIALRLITTDRAAKGLLASIYDLLPGIVAWSTKSWMRTATLCVSALSFSAFALWVGPWSLHRINVLTGSAHFVQLQKDGELLPAKGWYSKEVWRPGKTFESVVGEVRCLTREYRPWMPEVNEGVCECGEALEPTLIVNGINVSAVASDTTEGRRITVGVKSLRENLDAELPPRDVKDTLLLATWNIRQFDLKRRRLNESYYYIAEIISHFDILAVQEAQRDIAPLERVRELLGENWGLVYSLVSPGPVGNRERMAFFFDKRKVRLGPNVASVVLPAGNSPRTDDAGGAASENGQLARTPYLVTFNIADERLSICSVHLYFGALSGPETQRRINEISELSQYLVYLSENDPALRGKLILLGDIQSRAADSPELTVLRKAGFYIDPDLAGLPSNFRGTYAYDQIAIFRDSKDHVQIGQVGVFDFFKHVFKDDEELQYRADMGDRYLTKNGGETRTNEARSSYYRNQWRTYQMSDHLPKWLELRIPEKTVVAEGNDN